MTRTAAVASMSLGLFAAACLAPSTAIAGLLAEASATVPVSTASWAAIPTAGGGSTLTTSFTSAYGSGSNRYVLVDIVNTGATRITGFTLSSNRSAALAACATAWTAPVNPSPAPRCNGSTSGSSAGSFSGSGSSFALASATALAPGERLRLRIGPYNNNAAWNVSVSVTRSNLA